MQEGSPAPDDWLAAELARLYMLEQMNRPGIMLGFPVWGEAYIDRFAQFCMPSLLAPQNAEALRRLDAKIVIYTTVEHFKQLWRRTWPIERHGIRLEFGYFPAELLDGDQFQKYRVLGTVQNALIQRAARTGMGFHMITPDVVYSERYFDALAGLIHKHGAIANSCLSSSLHTIKPEIDAHRADDGSIRISAAALGDMSWRHLHPYMAASVMNGREVPPDANLLIWRGKDAVHIAAPHFNPIWISPELCRRAPCLSPTTLDAELPYFLPNGFYSPGPGDDMAMVELSEQAAKRVPSTVTMAEFTSTCWQQMNFDSRYLDFMRRRTRVAVAPRDDGMDDAEIDRQHKALIEQLIEQEVPMMRAFMLYSARHHRGMMRA